MTFCALSSAKGMDIKMKLDRQKYELARARACMGQKDLVAAGIPKGTLPWISSRIGYLLSFA
ncbi:hypothetical protein, partial [[Ruminococcus] torques]